MKGLLFALLIVFSATRAGAGVLDLGGLLPPGYFHPSFNRIAAGVFFPVAGAESQQEAGFIVPAIEHDAKDGFLLLPGVSWTLFNLGYKGSTASAGRLEGR